MTALIGVEDPTTSATAGLKGLRGTLCLLDGAQGSDWGLGLLLDDGTLLPLAAETRLRIADASEEGAAERRSWTGTLVKAGTVWSIRDEAGYWNSCVPLEGVAVELV